ncbi:squalene/phytoene synthase family protein [Lichenicoccus sp.]|uniref:squalene/phytoene synthase family protein n=1 Tax=Lichenicoccus sp. TaxID=2781899 RepID=UPI003D0F0AB2
MDAAGPMQALSPAGRAARTHDPDRFLIALFAPAGLREALFLLTAFNHELVRALEMRSARAETGPIASLIRLQWWREVVEGATRRHELAEPLGAALEAGVLDRATLLGIIEARESEAEGLHTEADWRAAQLGGAGGVQRGFGQVLGVSVPETLEQVRAVGAAYAAGAMRRHQAALAAGGRIAVEDSQLLGAGQEWLRQAGRPRLGRAKVAAALPAVFARRDLSRPPNAGPRGIGDRLALTAAWLRGAP